MSSNRIWEVRDLDNVQAPGRHPPDEDRSDSFLIVCYGVFPAWMREAT